MAEIRRAQRRQFQREESRRRRQQRVESGGATELTGGPGWEGRDRPGREGWEEPGREGPVREGPGREGSGREGPGREDPLGGARQEGREGPGREGPGREGPARERPGGPGSVGPGRRGREQETGLTDTGLRPPDEHVPLIAHSKEAFSRQFSKELPIEPDTSEVHAAQSAQAPGNVDGRDGAERPGLGGRSRDLGPRGGAKWRELPGAPGHGASDAGYDVTNIADPDPPLPPRPQLQQFSALDLGTFKQPVYSVRGSFHPAAPQTDDHVHANEFDVNGIDPTHALSRDPWEDAQSSRDHVISGSPRWDAGRDYVIPGFADTSSSARALADAPLHGSYFRLLRHLQDTRRHYPPHTGETYVRVSLIGTRQSHASIDGHETHGHVTCKFTGGRLCEAFFTIFSTGKTCFQCSFTPDHVLYKRHRTVEYANSRGRHGAGHVREKLIPVYVKGTSGPLFSACVTRATLVLVRV